MSAATTTSTNSTSDSTIVAPFEDIVQFIVNMNSKYNNNRDKDHPLPQMNMLIPLGAFRILCAISNGTVSQHAHM
jgi:hypothetical protein